VYLSNTGNANLSITNVAFIGTNAGDFAELGSCLGIMEPGWTCQMSVTFNPTATGARSATLAITDTASNSPQKIGLTGTAVAVPTLPGSYSFQLQATSSSATHYVLVQVIVQ
jgi:hypothetical protein